MSVIVEHEESAAVGGYRNLEAAITSSRARCGVIGLGQVGLPLSLSLCEAGFRVTGIDIDSNRVNAVRAGTSYVCDVHSDALRRQVEAKQFDATADLSEIGGLDAIIVCVPTPFRKSQYPDLSYVGAATEVVREHLRVGQLVVYETMTYPGVIEELLLPVLRRSGLEVGRDFFVACSPNRIDPGNGQFTMFEIPKVVGGVTARCRNLAALLYSKFVRTIVPVSSVKAAETVKFVEDAFRSVNIAFANEVAVMCSRAGLDVSEVIEAASTKPFGFMTFYPGPGLCGHGNTIDPLYAEWRSRSDGFASALLQLAEKINTDKPRLVANRVVELLAQRGKGIRDARIHVLGITYKRNNSDVRESPSVEIIRNLVGLGAGVVYSDPFVRRLSIDGRALESVEVGREVICACDVAIIATDHAAFDYLEIVRNAPLVVDTRNATRGLISPHVVRL